MSKSAIRASERAYATLLDEIQSGELPPGTVIGEVSQAERLGVSRTPMREAIGRLIADGLLRQQSARTIVVTGFDSTDIRALFETRRALEEASARLAATRGDRASFASLANDFAAAHLGQSDIAVDDYYALIARFDHSIDAAVDNAYLVSALRTIRTHLARARRLSRDNHARLTASASEHALIASAIAEGDADLAAGATRVHLHNALTSILSSIGSSTPEGQS